MPSIADDAFVILPRFWIGPGLSFGGGRVGGVTTSPLLLLSPVTARDVPVVMYPPLGFLVRGMGSFGCDLIIASHIHYLYTLP